MDREVKIAALRSHGYVFLDSLTPQQVTALNQYALSRPVYRDAHIPETARRQGLEPRPRREASDSECVCLSLSDAIQAPFLLERALELTDAVAAYLDCDVPAAYSANIFWTRPGKNVRPDIQESHRDLDDVRFVVMFTYLTDVLADQDGPHIIEGPDGNVRPIYGRAGTAFLADTSNLHCGLKPLREERGIAWWRWGVSDPPEAYRWDRNEPIPHTEILARYPDDLRLAWSMRLLVTPP